MPAEDIWFPVLGTGSVSNPKVKLGKFFSSMNLSLIQNFGYGKVA
jgi:hypothetical protein